MHRGALAMIKVYLDRGEKTVTDDGVMCVATVIFRPFPYKRFARPWSRMVRAWGANAFHATDFYNGAEEFKRATPAKQKRFQEDSRQIPRMISLHITRALAIAFRPQEAEPLLSQLWKERFGSSLHAMAVQLALISLGWWAKENRYFDGFAVFMESGDKHEALISEIVGNMRRDEIAGKHIQVKSFATVDKGVARGVEAADFFAWHYNTHYLTRIRTGRVGRKDVAAFVEVAADKVDEMFLTGWKLKHFLELGEAHLRKGDEGAL
jgi:hypothetical protein